MSDKEFQVLVNSLPGRTVEERKIIISEWLKDDRVSKEQKEYLKSLLSDNDEGYKPNKQSVKPKNKVSQQTKLNL